MATLNCDVGEGYGNWSYGDDGAIMPHIDRANIACGFHASDPLTMLKTIDLGIQHGKMMGAHPSLPDREGFGRREMHLGSEELTACFLYQISALEGMLRAKGKRLTHVKPHGIIYGMAARDRAVAEAIAKAVKPFDVPLFGMGGTAHEAAAHELGVSFQREFFADLEYDSKGELIIYRKHSDIDVPRAAARLHEALTSGIVAAIDGTRLPIQFETICMHSDARNAADLAAALRKVLSDVRRPPLANQAAK